MSTVLFIKVCGTTATGKTTIAVIIEKALKEAGFTVKPFDNMDGDADIKRQWLEDGLLKEVAFKTNVEIEEVHRFS